MAVYPGAVDTGCIEFDAGGGGDRDGISVKNSTDEYFSPKMAHKTRILRHLAIRAKTEKFP